MCSSDLTQAGITGWQAGQATTAVMTCLDNWLDNYGRDGEHEQRQIIKHIQAFIELHGSSRFQPCEKSFYTDNEQKVTNRVGYRKQGSNDYYFYINAFEKEVCTPYELKKVTQVLDDAGLLITNETNKKTFRVPAPTAKNPKARTRVYAIKSDILSYETDKSAGTARTQRTNHIEQGLEAVHSQRDTRGHSGHSEPQVDELSALSAYPKTRGTAANPVTTGNVPLSALSATKKQGTAKQGVIDPNNEIPPFGSEIDYS